MTSRTPGPRSHHGGRRHPPAEGRYFSLRSSDLRWRQPRNCSAAPLPRIMIFARAPGLSSPHGGPSPPPPRDGSATFATLTCAAAGAGRNTFDPQQTAIENRAGQPPPPLDTRKLQRVAASGALQRKAQPSSAERTEPRPGWRRLARPKGSQLSYWPPNSRAPDSKNYSAHGHRPRAWGNSSVSTHR